VHPVREAEKPGVDETAVAQHVAAWGLLAVATTTAVLVLSPGGVAVGSAPATLALAWVACVLSGVVFVPMPVRGTVQSTTLTELAQVPVVLLLPPVDALLVVVLAALASEAWLVRGRVQRIVFNVAWVASGVGLALLLRRWLQPGPFTPDLVGVGVAVLVAVVLVAVNLAAFSDIVAVRSRSRWSRVLVEQLPSLTTINLGTALAGVLAAVLLVAAPAGLVLLLVPVAAQRLLIEGRGRGQVRLAAERARLERTVDGASDGIVLLDRDGRVEVWNPVMADLTGVAEREALGRTLLELGLERAVAATEGGSTRMEIGVRVVDARAREVGAREDLGMVVTLRDVTREAELARIREDLVSLVSHELRTPVTTMVGFLDTLDLHWNELDDERRHELLGALRRGGDRLGSLVANIVAWERVDGRASVRGPAGACVVGEVLDGVLVALGTEVGRQGPMGTVVAMAPDELATVLRNLVANAISYGAAPVEVEVEHDLGAGRVVVHVVDHGLGLPAAFRPALFEPWRQATTGLRRTDRGIGMGLAVSRAVVEVAGGTIGHADVPGGGSRFSVSLPAA